MLGKAISVGARMAAVLLLAGAGTVLALGAGAATAEDARLLGPWLSEKKKLIIELYPCGEEICGRIAWLKNAYRDGELRRDAKNPDPALRDRPWCGIRVIEGLEPEGDGVWDGGHVYDPKRGDTYSVELTLKGEDRLKMRAYLGFKFLGKTQVWTRPDPDQAIFCVQES